MTRKQQENHFIAFTKKMEAILFAKGDDYANHDRLSNFKLSGAICQMTPQLQCLSLIATKVARLGVLLNAEDKPKNESIEDSITDLANYAVLLSMIIEDLNKTK